MRNPPPAPTKPVTAPTPAPSSAETQSLGGPGSTSRRDFLPRIMVTDVAIMMTANSIINTKPGIYCAVQPPTNAPTIDASPKGKPTDHETRFCLQCGIKPTSEVKATTTSDEAMASCAPIPIT